MVKKKVKMKKSIFGTFGVSNEDAENGKWFSLGGGVEFKIRRFTSRASIDYRLSIQPDFVAKANEDDLSDDEQMDIIQHQLAYAIIVDWKGVYGEEVDENGELVEIPFSPDNAYELITDERMGELLEKIVEISLAVDNYRYHVADAATKN